MSTNGKEKYLVPIAACIVLLVVGMIGTYFYMKGSNKPSPGAVASTGGEKLDLRLKTPYFFGQRDPRWGQMKIGGSGETIAAVGCTLCSLSMGICSLGGDTDPAELNQGLIANDGYTDRGWLIWAAVAKAEPGMEVKVYEKPNHAAMDEALRAGQIPLVKFWIGMGVPHWVAVVGKKGKEYLVLDPLEGEQAIKLSSRTETIESLRVVRRSN